MPTDNEIALEKILLRDRIGLMEGLVQYLVVDNEITSHSPILKPKASKILDLLTDFKNHIV